MLWYDIVCAVGIPSLISGIVLAVIQKGQRRRDLRQAEMARQNREMEQQNKAIMSGVQALLRDRLLQGYQYYMAKGYAGYDDRQNLENIYTQYHGLGKNGVMDHMREEFLRLPMRQEEDS